MLMYRIKKAFLIVYNIIRGCFYKVLYRNRFSFNYRCLIVPSAKIVVGKGTIVLGKDTSVSMNSYISSEAGGNINIGNFTAIGRNANIVSHISIKIGNDVAIGPNVCIYDHDHEWDRQGLVKGNYSKQDIEIGDKCWIGANVTILAGSKIGTGSIIGAGTIIRGIIPQYSKVYDIRTKKITQI